MLFGKATRHDENCVLFLSSCGGKGLPSNISRLTISYNLHRGWGLKKATWEFEISSSFKNVRHEVDSMDFVRKTKPQAEDGWGWEN